MQNAAPAASVAKAKAGANVVNAVNVASALFALLKPQKAPPPQRAISPTRAPLASLPDLDLTGNETAPANEERL